MRRQFQTMLLLSLALCQCLGGAISQIQAQELVITVKPSGDEQQEKEPFNGTRPAVDMAILLDTSNSMDGLIEQAKSQLWTIVQQFAKAKKAGKTPALRVAVFEYGNTRLPASEGYVRQLVGLTDDLDKVSESLFALTTSGGDEYCGQVINEALKRLDWSEEPNAYKTIFVAGNEPFTQGPVNYEQTCKKAIESGVVVNTIHCGNYQAGVSGMWQHGAQLAEGEYLNINQDQKVVVIKTPQDKILIELNRRLNRTYLWYGERDVRLKYRSNQVEQDENTLKLLGPSGLSSRAAVKGGSLYSNDGRDLVDSFNRDKMILDKVDVNELPDNLKKMSAPQRAEFVKKKAGERKTIQDQIAQANRERAKFIAKERSKQAASSNEDTLGAAVEAAITKQLKKSGFELGK